MSPLVVTCVTHRCVGHHLGLGDPLPYKIHRIGYKPHEFGGCFGQLARIKMGFGGVVPWLHRPPQVLKASSDRSSLSHPKNFARFTPTGVQQMGLH